MDVDRDFFFFFRVERKSWRRSFHDRTEINREFSKLGIFPRWDFEEVDSFLFFFFSSIDNGSRAQLVNNCVLISRCNIFHHRCSRYRPRIGKPVVPFHFEHARFDTRAFCSKCTWCYTFGYDPSIISLEERSHINTSLPYWSSRNSGYRRDAAVICDYSRVNPSVNLSTVVVRRFARRSQLTVSLTLSSTSFGITFSRLNRRYVGSLRVI